MAKSNLGGVYANMDFPPYVFNEFPKYIKTGDEGEHTVVNNAREEQEVRAKLRVMYDDKLAKDVGIVDPQHEHLISLARELGIPFNSRWSTRKIQGIIDEFQAQKRMDVDDLPPEENVENISSSSVTAQEITHTTNDDESKDSLVARAKSLGINATVNWGFPRLRREIATAEKNS